MKKIILWTMLLSSVLLASCSLTQQKKQTPEDLIKQTQTSFIKSMEDNVFAQKQAKFDGSLKLDVKSPLWWWNAILAYNWQWNHKQANVNLNFSWSANVQWKTGKANLSAKFVVTLDKMYMQLSKLNAQLPDSELQSYIAMAGMIMNKRFYLDLLQNKSKQLTLNLRNIDLKAEFEKYSVFKINKEIKDKEYNVSLDKDNLANIAYNVSKALDPTFTWTKQEILTTTKSMDVTWVLNIKWDKYFTFSWSMINGLQNIPFEIHYLKNKLYIKVKGVIIDITKDGDKFNGTISVTQTNVNLDIDWELNKWTFKLNIWYNKAPINLKLSLIYNAKKIDKLDIIIPKDATDVQIMLQNVMWASSWIPAQK